MANPQERPVSSTGVSSLCCGPAVFTANERRCLVRKIEWMEVGKQARSLSNSYTTMCTEMMRSRDAIAIDERDPNLHAAACTVSHVDTPVSTESLCVRLRRERERRQIALSSISANTKISVSLFEALERGDVSRWPSGIYRRSFVRAYAKAIGLDPDTVAREFAEQFPDPAETRETCG